MFLALSFVQRQFILSKSFGFHGPPLIKFKTDRLQRVGSRENDVIYSSLSELLRARVVINFVMRVASPLENTDGERRALSKFLASWDLLSNLADTSQTGQQTQS